jgi:hypothetical protein
VSLQYANHPTPGIAIFGNATVPPPDWAFVKYWSTDETSTVHTYAITAWPSIMPRRAHQTPVDPRLVSRTCFNQPVRYRTVPFGELPVKKPLVEFYRSLGIFGMDLEMDDSRHNNELLPLNLYKTIAW